MTGIAVDAVVDVVRAEIAREVGEMLIAFEPTEVSTSELISMAVLLRPIAQRAAARRRTPQKPRLTVVGDA